MKSKRLTLSFRRALVPIVAGCDSTTALGLAQVLAREVVLVGLVRVAAEEALSAAAGEAREVRVQLRRLGELDRVRVKARVHVSHSPWRDLLTVIAGEKPDLLVMEWVSHLDALGLSASEALASPPCNLALVRGPLPDRLGNVLVPLRGGPHAELALRLAIALRPQRLIPLHLAPEGGTFSDAPFRGLEKVLKKLPDVQARFEHTHDPAQTILDEAKGSELVVLGATAQPLTSRTSLGPVSDRLLRECPAAVIAVKTRRAMPLTGSDETVGAQAISILVDKWFAENTFTADEFANLEHLLALKRQQRVTISLALPALNEEETVAKVIRTIKRALVDKVPLLDEICLIDSDSADRTREIASAFGIPVHIHQRLLPELGARAGKGEALWKSLLVTHGDILAWIDTDIVNIHPRFVYGILGPLLLDPRVQLAKGFYRRPLKVGDRFQAGGGGRVTELAARPLINLFYPELSGIIQPLSGEYAGRRSALEQLPFFSGYGVETGLLIDVFEHFGLWSIAQVDLLERVHHSQTLEALSKMSFAIIQSVMRKLERRHGSPILEDVNKSMKLIRYQAGAYFLEVEEIAERERPPMVQVPAYRQAHHVDGGVAPGRPASGASGER